eukprot:707054_1
MSTPVKQPSDDSDPTLTIHLNAKLVPLNTYQVLQIMEIIKSRSPTQHISANNNHDEDGIQFEYVLDVNDTFLHSMCKDSHAATIQRIIDHKLIVIVIVLLWIMWIPMLFIFGGDNIVYSIYLIILYSVPCIPWLIFKHLLFNKIAFKLCIQTFDYWIKVGYGLVYNIAVLFHFRVNITLDGFTLATLSAYIELVLMVLFISYVSSFDAVHTSKTKKLVLTVLGSALFSWNVVYTQFLWDDENDYEIMNLISLQSLLSSSSRILAIFLWKQSYKIWNSKGTAVTITESPKIIWIDMTAAERKLANTITASNELDSESVQKVPEIDLQSDVKLQENANRRESMSTSQLQYELR